MFHPSHLLFPVAFPLVNIGGFAKAMSERLDMPRGTIAKYSAIIADEVRRLEDILARVMDFSKPPRPLMRQSRICPVIMDTLDQLRDRAANQNVSITTDLPDEAVLLHIDPDQMKQVFLNLFQNALDVMKDGGELDIAVQQDGGFMVIRIRNTGRPIHPEDQANLFEPFFSTKPGGTGLGLTVSLKIIQDHGGDIRTASDLEQGTVFTISLPLDHKPDRAMRHHPPHDQRSTGR
jgi:signal transduction histidine kinase